MAQALHTTMASRTLRLAAVNKVIDRHGSAAVTAEKAYRLAGLENSAAQSMRFERDEVTGLLIAIPVTSKIDGRSATLGSTLTLTETVRVSIPASEHEFLGFTMADVGADVDPARVGVYYGDGLLALGRVPTERADVDLEGTDDWVGHGAADSEASADD